MNLYLPQQILAVHAALDHDGIPHAFGGAIALAYCDEPRATYVINVNIFLNISQRHRVLDSLSTLFLIADRPRVEQEVFRSAQTRLRWGQIPVDLFFSDIPYHDSLAARARDVDFIGTRIKVLSAEDLILCKAAFNRPKDWIDIENIFRIQQHKLDAAYLRYWLDEFFDETSEQTQQIEHFIRRYSSRGPGPP